MTLVVDVQGPNTGSTAACPIGAYEFKAKSQYKGKGSRLVWDERCARCCS